MKNHNQNAKAWYDKRISQGKCGVCGKDNDRTPLRRCSECKDRHAVGMRKTMLFRNYRLDEDTYQQMLEHQRYECMICEKPLTGKIDVDHNHATGQVRGLLHHNCNVALGFLEEDPKRCIQAATYLRYFQEAV